MESPVFVHPPPLGRQSIPKLVSKRRYLNPQPGNPAHQRKDIPPKPGLRLCRCQSGAQGATLDRHTKLEG